MLHRQVSLLNRCRNSLKRFLSSQNVVKKPVMPDCETVDQDKINKLLLIIYPPQQNMEDEENEEESKAPYDPDDDPQEKAEKEILEILRPFTEAAVRENFPEYDAEYHEPMCRFAEHFHILKPLYPGSG